MNLLTKRPTRTSLKIMIDVIYALMIRELRTRFGTTKLGYFWAVSEPMVQASILAIIYSMVGRENISGIPVAMFILVAIIPFKLFSKLVPQLTVAVESNRGLLGYRQVQPIDPLISRTIIESLTFFLVYLLLMIIMTMIGFDAIPDNLLELLIICSQLILMAIGIGLFTCTISIWWADIKKIVSMVMQPMFFISGIFFSATMIPQKYWFLFTWNPLFHMTELSRDAYFTGYVTPVGSINYLILVSFGCFSLGLLFFSANRHRFSML